MIVWYSARVCPPPMYGAISAYLKGGVKAPLSYSPLLGTFYTPGPHGPILIHRMAILYWARLVVPKFRRVAEPTNEEN